MVDVSTETLKKAQGCLSCPICKSARKTQKGFAYWFVKYVDRKICPQCKAYEEVTGQLAYEPLTQETTEKLTGD